MEPVEVDTKLAALHNTLSLTMRRLEGEYDRIHSLLGEKREYISKWRSVWPTANEEAFSALKARLESGDLNAWDAQSGQRAVDATTLLLGEIDVIATQIQTLNEIFLTNPWSRFFLVTSSAGHIHKDMECSTCRPRTTYGWLPQLSGKTEAEAVADQGPMLCSVCFPTAPVEWTVGKHKKG